ncbi:MAG: potassium-transporting ATPase subunit F [Dokdonella sp.]|nr:potassium-transporting ATPase subunit F [Dokdonella sp.]MCB1575219.1 potassium-transporting ATPase subunit F [Xanthomonadales bacterium]MCB1577319.1 potassium-transporting ATPase subunit F [Xanthomonadales bacterium]
MPGWLIAVCAVSAVLAAVYLLYVIVRPEDF